MKFIDANKLSNVSNLNTDICIVGAGVAGITLASELDGISKNVCLVESGAYKLDEEVQSLCELENLGYPIRENFMSRVRHFGGTSNIWPGKCMLLDVVDFKKRSWVPDSGWPIYYSELFKHYQKASEVLNLPSFDKFDSNFWEQGASEKEKTFFHSKLLKLNVSMWAKKPLNFGKAYFSKLKRAPNVTVFVNSNSTEIELSDNGKSVESIHLACLNGNRFSIKAKVFILACGGLENARLLLVSKKQHANGVGNHYDVVGRYYMDHPRSVFGRVHLNGDYDLSKLLGFLVSEGKVQIGIALPEKIQMDEGLLNNYLSLERKFSEVYQETYYTFIQLMKRLFRKGHTGKRLDFKNLKTDKINDLIYLLTPKEIIPHFAYRCYRALKKKRTRELVVVNYCEQQPNPESRVHLSNKRDRLNTNSLILDWKVGSEEKRTLLRLQEIFGEYLIKNGIGFLDNKTDSQDGIMFTDASHHMGTTRMSDSPKKGVVDKNCKVHGINNLFIAGSSVFPAAGYANPTLTIVAFSLRLAEYIKR